MSIHIAVIVLCCLHSPLRQRYSIFLPQLSSLEMAAVIDWISFCSVFESWGKYTRQIRRIEGFIFSNLKRIHPANPFDFADVFPANL